MFSRKAVLVCCLWLQRYALICRACHYRVWSCCTCRIIGFLLYLTGITYWAIIQDIVHPDRVGGVSGFMHFLANTSGIIGPTVTGYIVEYTGAFTSAFCLREGWRWQVLFASLCL